MEKMNMGTKDEDCLCFHETNQQILKVVSNLFGSVIRFVVSAFAAFLFVSCLILAGISIAALLGYNAENAIFPPYNGKPLFSPMTRTQAFFVLSFLTILTSAVLVTVATDGRYWVGMIKCACKRRSLDK